MEALTPSPSTAVPAPPAAGAPSDVSVLSLMPPRRHRLLPWPARRQAASASLPPGVGAVPVGAGTCVALVALSSMESRPPVNKARLLLNPRDIDIHR